MKMPLVTWAVRWESAFLLFMGCIFNYALRLNVNIAIIRMSNSTHPPMWPFQDRPRLDWSAEERSFILSAFFYGYCVLQIPGGRLAEMYGTKRVLGYSMLAVSILGLLTPLAAYTSTWLVFLLRVLQGLCEGVCFPSVNPYVARWATREEKGRFTTFCFLGSRVGPVITYPVCGFLLNTYPWEVVFYSTSMVSLAWTAAWFLLASDLPENHPRLSSSEKQLILTTRSYDPVIAKRQLSNRVLPLLWDMLQNRAVLANMFFQFCQSWGNIMILTMTPTFMDKVLKFDIKSNGFLSMLPMLCCSIVGPLAGLLSDFLTKRGLAPLTIQKSFVTLYGVGMATGLVAISQLSSWELRYYCVAVMSASYALCGFQYSGPILNMQSIAPNNSGTIFGLSNTVGHISGFLMPVFIGALTSCPGCESDPLKWSYAFWIFAGLYVVGFVAYVLFAQIEEQPFNSKDYSSLSSQAVAEPTFRPSYRKRALSISEYL